MLRKSKSSAVWMSAICVGSFSLVTGLVSIVIPYLVSGNMQTVIADPTKLSEIEDILVLAGLLLVLLLLLILVGAYWMYRFFGEGYYGSTGAARWALFGAFFAFLMALPDWLMPETWSPIIILLKFLAVFAAFFLARKIIPVRHLPKKVVAKKQKPARQNKKAK